MSAAVARRRRLGQERLRLRAGRMFDRGLSQAVVMHPSGVARQRGNDWQQAWAAGGLDGLRSRGPTGPKPRISDGQWAGVEARLLAGSVAYGFDSGVWTLPRIARVIRDLTGVRYDQSGVWRLLNPLGWRVRPPVPPATAPGRGGEAPGGRGGWPPPREPRRAGERVGRV